jgi:hypothetical protein
MLMHVVSQLVVEGRVFDTLILVILAITLALAYYYSTKGIGVNLRKLPALDAIEEAIGRAAEMGRPVHATSGTGGLRLNAAETVAGLNVLTYVSTLCARLGVKLIVTNQNPEVVPMQEELVREAYLSEGKLDEYSSDIVRHLSDRNMAYTAMAQGIIAREKVAAQICVGNLGMETLILWEAAKRIGGMNIGGTQSRYRQHDLAVGSDYMLIGEDIFAAGAYISGDPLQQNSIATQDVIKGIILAILVIGGILSMLGNNSFINILKI